MDRKVRTVTRRGFSSSLLTPPSDQAFLIFVVNPNPHNKKAGRWGTAAQRIRFWRQTFKTSLFWRVKTPLFSKAGPGFDVCGHPMQYTYLHVILVVHVSFVFRHNRLRYVRIILQKKNKPSLYLISLDPSLGFPTTTYLRWIFGNFRVKGI